MRESTFAVIDMVALASAMMLGVIKPRSTTIGARARERVTSPLTVRLARQFSRCNALAIFVGVLVALSAVPATPMAASADIFNMITANELLDPTSDFTQANALFAYVTSNASSGRVCVVEASMQDPGDGSASCDKLIQDGGDRAWGTSNTIPPLFAGFTLLEPAKTLKLGAWKLLGDGGDGPGQDRFSAPFTVAPCPETCDRFLADFVVNDWKAAARQTRDASAYFCTIAELVSVGKKINGARSITHTIWWQAEGIPKLRTVKFDLGGLGVPTSSLSFYMAVLRYFTCLVYQAEKDIADDPLDPNYTIVVTPQFKAPPISGNAAADSLAVALERIDALARAQLTSYERYLGAVAAGAQAFVHAQAIAVARYGQQLAGEMQTSAGLMRTLANDLASDPNINNPVVNQTDLNDIVAIRQRITTSGFLPEEIQPLLDAGLTQADIDEIRAGFAADLSAAPVGVSIESVLIQFADAAIGAATAFDRLARNAAVVADVNNVPPSASFEASPTSGPPPLAVRFTDRSSDSDLDSPISVSWDFGDSSTASGSSVTHTYNNAGTYTVTEFVSDYLATATASQQIVVSSNHAPMAIDDVLSTAEDSVGSVNVLSNDIDRDGDALSVTSWSLGSHGFVHCASDGYCSYEPARNFNGSDAFTYVVSDGNNATATGNVQITIQPAPDPPIANADRAFILRDTAATLNVLANDYDVDGDSLTVASAGPASRGQVSCTAAGLCTFIPDHGYVGPASFDYTVSDGRLTAGASVLVTVETPPPLDVFIAYADDLRGNPADFPVPWAGAPNTTFLGENPRNSPWDDGAIRLDNRTGSPVHVDRVVVTFPGIARGTYADYQVNLWGNFDILAGQSAILTATLSDNFDGSDFPETCSPLGPGTEPVVTIEIGGVAFSLVDGYRILDTGGIDPASCAGANESHQWSALGKGSPAGTSATLTLAPAMQSQSVGLSADVYAHLVDSGGDPLPNVRIDFAVSSGPNKGPLGSAFTDSQGNARLRYIGASIGLDIINASVLNPAGAFASTNQVPVAWTLASGTIIVREETLPPGDPAAFAFTGSAAGTVGDGQTITVHGLAPGVYTSMQTPLLGWDVMRIRCDDSDSVGNVGSATATIQLSAGEIVTCTFTDTKRGTIIVRSRTDPADAPGLVTFSGGASGAISDGGEIAVTDLAANHAYDVREGDPTPEFDLTAIICDDSTSVGRSTGDLSSRSATFRLDPGERIVCTFINTKRATVEVHKTVTGSVPVAGMSFDFQLRKDATSIASGTVLATETASATNDGIVSFRIKLPPGSYELCEVVMPGWRTSLSGSFVPGGSTDNSTLCITFALGAGEVRVLAVDNLPPPGGLTRSIGFWKNWASCAKSNGPHRAVLDQTLQLTDVTIGVLVLHDSNADPNAASDCLSAVRLLDKSTVDKGVKMSSDPAFEMATQLLAAKLNLSSGAKLCPSASSAINSAQVLLAAIKFDGIKHSKMTTAQVTQATTLATQLDRYNNNALC